MSGWTITVSNSVRMSAPVGHASRQPAWVQCLHTSDMNSQLPGSRRSQSWLPSRTGGIAGSSGSGASVSTKRTWRHVFAPSDAVWSYEPPLRNSAPSEGRSFHCLHATSHALQPMHTVVSVKKPMRWASWRWMAISLNSGTVQLRGLGGVVVVRADVAVGVRVAQRRGGRARPAPRAHVARERLGLLDVDVRV